MTLPLPPAKPKRTGNYKAGPGRPPGRKNNSTLQLEEAARQAAASLSGAFEGDAHAFLAAVYKNPTISPLEIRILAAGRALRVEKPVLSAVYGRMDLNMSLAGRLDAARKRIQALGRTEAAVLENPKSLPPHETNSPARLIDQS